MSKIEAPITPILSHRPSTNPSSFNRSMLPQFSHAKPKEKPLKHRMREHRKKEAEHKQRHADRMYRRKLIRRQLRVQQELEYITFPTMMVGIAYY